MKNTDKVTLTVGQLKKLVKEAKKPFYGWTLATNPKDELLELGEKGQLSWETIAKEFLRTMSMKNIEMVYDKIFDAFDEDYSF